MPLVQTILCKWSKVSPRRKEILVKIFAIDESLGIQSIVRTWCITLTKNHLVRLY